MKEVTLSYWRLREPGEGSLQSSLAGRLWGGGLDWNYRELLCGNCACVVFSSLNFYILKQDSEEEEQLFLEMPLLVELRVVVPRGAQEKSSQ